MPTMREAGVQSLGRKDPQEKAMAITPVFLPGKSHEQKSLVVYSPWGHKELDRTEQCHSLTPVFLPGKSHEQKSLAGFSPLGHKRIGYDLATKQHFF